MSATITLRTKTQHAGIDRSVKFQTRVNEGCENYDIGLAISLAIRASNTSRPILAIAYAVSEVLAADLVDTKESRALQRSAQAIIDFWESIDKS